MSPKDNPTQSPPPHNLNFLYQRHRSRLQDFQRTTSPGNHDLDRREAYGEKFARMYPRDVRQTGASQRYPSPSSPHPITSPLLSALGSTGATAAQYTSDWTKSLPFFTTSQTIGVSESPPNAIPIQVPRETISTSPPTIQSRSQPNNNGLPLSLSPRLQPPKERRSSLYSQVDHYQTHRASAPLPHEDQAHFYAGGLPDFDTIGVPQPIFNGLMPGEKGYFCGWDTLADSGHAPSVTAENVLIVGHEGGLNAYRISKKEKPVKVGSLSGLKGAVIDAKILPWTCRDDPGSDCRPYIALIIHGPVIEDSPEPQNSSDESAAVSTEDDSPAPSERAEARRDHRQSADEAIKCYRTTVEIYSLSTSRYVETVYASPPAAFNMPIIATVEVKIPPPIGDLKIDAKGKYLIVASGESGEIFIFSPACKPTTKSLESVRCIGKLWTTVEKRNVRRSTSGTPGRTDAGVDDLEPQRGVPLFSLSHRLLAIVPPDHSTTYSINGVAHTSAHSKRPPGITHHTAPGPISATCETDEKDTIDTMNQMSRQVAQGAVVAGNYIKDRGIEAFKNYWNNGQNNQTGNRTSFPPTDQIAPRFPPTHGYHGPVSQSQSSQVAIYDLQRFLDAEEHKVKNVLAPLSSFNLASGCSLVSFSPNGHHLLTVSRKGDVQSIWSLMKMRDSRTGHTVTKPFIRNIKNFTRWSITKIIDVAWAEPHGQRLALLSENGTVHVHELPPSRFQWPPSRRVRRAKASAGSRKADEAEPASTTYSGYAKEAINSASTWVNHYRQRTRSGQMGVGGYAFTPANLTLKTAGKTFKQGAKAIAKGATAVYNISDNKLHMQSKFDVLRPRSIRFLTGRSLHGYLGVVAAGTVELYQVRTVTSSKSSGGPPEYKTKISKKGTSFELKPIPSDVFARAVVATLTSRARGDSNPPVDAFVTGDWTLRAPASSIRPSGQNLVNKDWRIMIEADTNPAYQPFHTDRRVSLFAFAEPEQAPPRFPDRSASQEDFERYEADRTEYEEQVLRPHVVSLHHTDDSTPWLFGQDMPGLRVIKEGGGGAANAGLSLGVEDEEGGFEYNVVKLDDGAGTLIMNTVPRTARVEDDFFEDGAEMIDFTDDASKRA